MHLHLLAAELRTIHVHPLSLYKIAKIVRCFQYEPGLDSWVSPELNLKLGILFDLIYPSWVIN